MSNEILIGNQRQAQLEAAKAAFFKSGGEIESLPAFQFKPMPPRTEPEPKEKHKATGNAGERAAKANETANMVAAMAESMTCADISKALGIPGTTLRGMAIRHGFTFYPGPQGRRVTGCYDDEMDAKLAERLKAMSQIGLSRNHAAKHLQVGHATITRICKKFDIEFSPRARLRKP